MLHRQHHKQVSIQVSRDMPCMRRPAQKANEQRSLVDYTVLPIRQGPRTSRSRLCMKQTHETRGTNCRVTPNTLIMHASRCHVRVGRVHMWHHVWVVSQERWARRARGMEAVASEL